MIKPIRNETDHQAALLHLRKLWKAEVGTPEHDDLEVLGTLVSEFERGRRPNFERFLFLAREPENPTPFDRPLNIPCPRCDGALAYTSNNMMGTLAFIECQGSCRHAFTVGVKHSLPGKP